ncbi:hypothetical protein SAICODRAFT_29968 [Saitoella complicata NRRL Y-17804]|uniref:uncharacterized protein n=1 Tax=Saitoella complicata (strain BCRC 22490 / CBS 7301 / JCM 7358 / NBRC 10748 / NRRL Y-17804) TaxID=698492 RepID=UPI000867F3A0|nr:uncharacterized protein SAICODRAFT_29968 [Saitoella complicata NRRL Y-17804]ODQ53570.1 hypothetical protein SAICODRAFT_29968 [Saitoella complicata NRRL Y-17804]
MYAPSTLDNKPVPTHQPPYSNQDLRDHHQSPPTSLPPCQVWEYDGYVRLQRVRRTGRGV